MFLVITRKTDQGIEVEGPAKITVLSIRDGTVRLGITADKNVSVWRTEISQERREVVRKELAQCES